MLRWVIIASLIASTSWAEKSIDDKIAEFIPLFRLKAMPQEIVSNEDLYKLGEALFLTRQLSGNKNISCADCHNPSKGTTDKLPLGLGQGHSIVQDSILQAQGHILARNTPPLYNLGQVSSLFWDSRVSKRIDQNNGEIIWTTPTPLGPWKTNLTSALAAQALFPILSPEEMRGFKGQNTIADIDDAEKAWQAITDQVAKNTAIKKLFDKAYPNQKPHIFMVGNALAEFQRVRFSSHNSPYDLYLEGNLKALSDEQKKGMELFFGKADCGRCHNGTHLSNFAVHSLAIPQWSTKEAATDKGVGNWMEDGFGAFRFRVPPLRNIGYTAPYMHNGFFQNLKDVVTHYNHFPRTIRHLECPKTPGNYTEELICDTDTTRNNARISSAQNSLNFRLGLSPTEIDQIVSFLQSLNDPNFQ